MFSAVRRRNLCIAGYLILVYLSWGSIYIANRFAVESLPPFLMCGARTAAAGVLLYLFTWLRGERRSPNTDDLRHGLVLGFLMVFIHAGLLTWGQLGLASGTAALIIGSVPIWMVTGGWLLRLDPRPTPLQTLGLIGGFSGLLLLSAHQGNAAGGSMIGLIAVWVSALGWVAGSLYSKFPGRHSGLSLFRFSAWILLLGGIQCLVWSLIIGEWSAFNPENVTARSMAAFGYMVVVGSVIGYTCYFWLLTHTRTEVAISYEYVDPVIAVFLGWLLAGELLDGTILLACALTVGSVFFLVSHKH